MTDISVKPPSDLDWIKLRKEMDEVASEKENKFFATLKRKVIDHPLVPIGCLATVAALSYGLWSFQKGNKQMSQYMMRARVIAQGFTIVVAVGGTMAAQNRNSHEQSLEIKQSLESKKSE